LADGRAAFSFLTTRFPMGFTSFGSGLSLRTPRDQGGPGENGSLLG
jgi:hypothetical protein